MATGKLINSANNVTEDDLQENGGTVTAQDGVDDAENIPADMPEQETNSAIEVDGNVFFTDEADSVFTEPSASSPKDATPLQRAVGEMYGNPILTEDQKTIKSIGKKLGWKILFDNVYVKDAQGNYVLDAKGRRIRANADIDFKNRTITIDFNCKKPIQFLFKHELTDYISQNRAVFFDLMNTVMDSGMFNEWVKSKGYASVQDMVEDVIQQRTAAGDPNFVGKSQNDLEIEANIEMTSDFIGENCFGGKNSLDGFLESLQPEQRKNFIQRFLDFLRSIRDRIAGNKTLEDDIARIEKQFVKAYKAVEVSQQQKNTDQKGGVRYEIYNHKGVLIDVNWDSDNFSGLKQQLKNNLEKIKDLQPVADIHYIKTTGKELNQKVTEEYKKIGFKVDVKNFGEIEIGKNEIKDATDNYINNDAEAAALLSVPKVLKRGKIISGHRNHKNRGYPTITFAAPVLLNGKVGNVVVAVKVAGKTRYNAHRVLMPDGTEFILDNEKNTESQSARMTIQNDGQRSANDSVSGNMITQNEPIVNNEYMQENKRYSITPETQLDLFEKFKSGELSEDEYRQIISNEKVLNPVEIANLTEKDANTTPKLEKQKGVNKGNKQSKTYGSLLGSSIFDDTFKDEIKAMIYEIKTAASDIACGCNDLSLFLFCFCGEFGNPHNPKGSGYCK